MRFATIAAIVAAAVLVPSAGASTWLQFGLVDTQEALGDQARFGRTLQNLRPQVVRVMLAWGGQYGVARERPGPRHRPGGPGLRVGPVRPGGADGAGPRRQRPLHDLRDAVVGERRPRPERRAPELQAARGVRVRRGEPLQRHLPPAGRRRPPQGLALDGVERAEHPARAEAPVAPDRRPLGDPERARLRADLQLDLRRDPPDAPPRREGRVRRDDGAREQRAEDAAPVRRADRVHPGAEGGRAPRHGRLRPSPLLGRPEVLAGGEAAQPEGDHAREHLEADPRGDAAASGRRRSG